MTSTNVTNVDPPAPDGDGASRPAPGAVGHLIVVLDTNVYQEHCFGTLLLDEIAELLNAFEGSLLVLPEVVAKELATNFATKVARRFKGQKPGDLRQAYEAAESDVAEALRGHWDQWYQRLQSLSQHEPVSDADLRAAYERLINGVPPCHNRDETRDALIWECCLRHGAEGTVIAFVTNNTKDFPFGSNAVLDAEARRNAIVPFNKWSDLRAWAHPVVAGYRDDQVFALLTADTGPVTFEEWYPAMELDSSTAETLEDVLPEYLMGVTEYYESDAEVYDLERERYSIRQIETGVAGLEQFEVEEEWSFGVSFAVGATIHVGGRDGVDFTPSGHARAQGRAVICREITVTDDEHVEQDATVKNVDLEYDDDWDPYVAMTEE